MLRNFLKKRTPPQPIVETVPKSQYDTLAAEHEALGFDYALVVALAKKAITLLGKINDLGDNRKVTVALRKETTTLLEEAQSAGLLEEKKGEESDAASNS